MEQFQQNFSGRFVVWGLYTHTKVGKVFLFGFFIDDWIHQSPLLLKINVPIN